MMRKRLLCAVLALIWLFSVQPIAAAVDIENAQSTTITADCRLPIIKVTVPTTGSVYLNPFQLLVSIGDEESNAQIISAPACIANESEVPISVDATITGEIVAGSDLQLSQSSTKDTDSTDKSAFIYFEIKTANTANSSEIEWDEAFDSTKHVVVGTETITKTGIVTLAAKAPNGGVAEGGYAPFRLTGDAVKFPETSWSSKDGIMVTVAFTFTPLSYPADAQ